MTTLQPIKWLDLSFKPTTVDLQQQRFYEELQKILQQMAGKFDANDRVVTYQDLKTLGLI